MMISQLIFWWSMLMASIRAAQGSDSPHPAHNMDTTPNFYPDPAPFHLGVASGDPLPDSIILWTRATPRNNDDVVNGTRVSWRIWAPPFTSEEAPELQGNATGTEATDWTIKIDASPLSRSNQTYYYRFYFGFRTNTSDINGEKSRLGRTRTAPDANVTEGLVTFAHTTCTEQGYHLNAFAHLAWNMTLGGEVHPSLRPNRNSSREPDENLLLQSESIHAVLHGGDSFYDFNRGPRSIEQWNVDGAPYGEGLNESYMPLPNLDYYDDSWGEFSFCYSFACFPTNRDNWRWWHITSRLDPDRRAAMAAHPHVMTPDSHDGGPQGNANASTQSLQIFDLYYPVRTTYSIHPLSNETQIEFYRDFKFGELAHLIVLDMRGLGKMQPERSFWGIPQRDYLRRLFQNGTKGFKVWNNGKPIVTNQITGWRRTVIGVNLMILTVILLSLSCCVIACCKKQKLILEQNNAMKALESLEETKNTKHYDISAEDDEQRTKGTTRMKRLNYMLERLDCCPVSGNGQNFGPKKRCCLNCCGSYACITLALVCIPLPFVGMNIMLGVVEGQERLMYHPSTDTETIFGESINLVGNPVDRAELFKDMYDNGEAHDNIFLTGDSHMFWASNVNINSIGHYVLPEQAKELRAAGYNVFADSSKLSENEAKIGVEVMPSSTSSHGIYDFLLEAGLADWQAAWASAVVTGVFKHYNSHFMDLEVTSHGIGFVHITETEATFEYFRACVFRAFRQSVLYWTARVNRGSNEWNKDDLQRYTENWESEAGYKWYW